MNEPNNSRLTQKIFLVKFESGYFAESQPYHHWLYTDDPYKAKKYSKVKDAERRGTDASKYVDAKTHPNNLEFTIEEWDMVVEMKRHK
jgi:hypothetical protein